MTFHRDLQTHLENWLDEQFTKRREDVLNGSCKSIEEYRNRCGYLEALRHVADEMKEWVRQVNDDEAGRTEEQL